jgi:hypothetical protein
MSVRAPDPAARSSGLSWYWVAASGPTGRVTGLSGYEPERLRASRALDLPLLGVKFRIQSNVSNTAA